MLICAMFGIPPDRAIALVLLRRVRDVVAGVPGVIAWRVMLSSRPAKERVAP